MARYIELDALVAEIERLRKSFKVISVASPSRDTTLENIAKAALCRQILSFIDSMQKEEIPPKLPLISQKKCMYTKDDFTDEDRKVLCDGCKEECEYAQKEEPVSEELESWDKFSHIDDAIEDYCRYDSHIVFFTESLNGEPLEEADDREQVESAFKAGTQWQKRKDNQNFKELAVLANHQDGCFALENIQMRLNELIKED